MSGSPMPHTFSPAGSSGAFSSGRFQLLLHHRQVMAGDVYIHARLLAWRHNKWTIIGVFQMNQPEWDALVDYCAQLGIEVTEEPE